MNQISLENLGLDIIMDILSRLPLPSVIYCMCVCKTWFKLVCTPHFADHHLCRSKRRVPALLAIDHLQPEHSLSYKLFDFVDHGIPVQRHEHHYNPVAEFRLPYLGKIHGSINGFLLSADLNLKPDALSICNPVTREYVTIVSPQNFVCSDGDVMVYGFGVSNLLLKYKVLRILQGCRITGITIIDTVPEKWVYTVGTGEWREIKTQVDQFYLYRDPYGLFSRSSAQFLNGILHWVARDKQRKLQIACFDVEKEEFYCIPPPPPREKSTRGCMAALCAPGDSLWFCDSLSDTEIGIWSRRDQDKTWEKLLAFPRRLTFFSSLQLGMIFPLKVFSDGDVLFEWDYRKPFYYNFKDGSFSSLTWGRAIIYIPTFISLKNFNRVENVANFE